MDLSWRKYQDLLMDQVTEAKFNVKHAETQLKQAKAKLGIAERGLEQFNILLDEKMSAIEKESK